MTKNHPLSAELEAAVAALGETKVRELLRLTPIEITRQRDQLTEGIRARGWDAYGRIASYVNDHPQPITAVYGSHMLTVCGILKRYYWEWAIFQTSPDGTEHQFILKEPGRHGFESGELVQATGQISWTGNNDPYSKTLIVHLTQVQISLLGVPVPSVEDEAESEN